VRHRWRADRKEEGTTAARFGQANTVVVTTGNCLHMAASGRSASTGEDRPEKTILRGLAGCCEHAYATPRDVSVDFMYYGTTVDGGVRRSRRRCDLGQQRRKSEIAVMLCKFRGRVWEEVDAIVDAVCRRNRRRRR